MRRLALLLLLAPALLALPAGGDPVAEGGGGGDCPQDSNVVTMTAANPDLVTPRGIDVDPQGHVWVADSGTNTVYEFDQNGNQVDAIPPTAGIPNFTDPNDVAVADDGDVVVTDEGTDTVQVFDSAGNRTNGLNAVDFMPQLQDPFSVAVNADASRIWVVDNANGFGGLRRIRLPDGGAASFVNLSSGPGMPGDTRTLARRRSDGQLAMAARSLGDIFRLDPAGEPVAQIQPAQGFPDLTVSNGLAYDTFGNLLTVDRDTDTVQRFGADGIPQLAIDGVANGGLEVGRDVTVGRRGDIWVTNDGASDNTVLRWCFRVDARLRRGNAAFVGNTTVNRTGTGQVLTATVRPGVPTNFWLRIDGESNAQHRVRVRATPAANIRWFDGNRSVTGFVNGAGHRTGMIVPGTSYDLRIDVRTTVDRTLTIRTSSEAAPNRVDVVKLRLRVQA